MYPAGHRYLLTSTYICTLQLLWPWLGNDHCYFANDHCLTNAIKATVYMCWWADIYVLQGIWSVIHCVCVWCVRRIWLLEYFLSVWLYLKLLLLLVFVLHSMVLIYHCYNCTMMHTYSCNKKRKSHANCKISVFIKTEKYLTCVTSNMISGVTSDMISDVTFYIRNTLRKWHCGFSGTWIIAVT